MMRSERTLRVPRQLRARNPAAKSLVRYEEVKSPVVRWTFRSRRSDTPSVQPCVSNHS
ncbi:MAG: hypothetical protein KHX48_09500 [Alistipes sp.]|nr:hypothetical protein [Alistipes sp.]